MLLGTALEAMLQGAFAGVSLFGLVGLLLGPFAIVCRRVAIRARGPAPWPVRHILLLRAGTDLRARVREFGGAACTGSELVIDGGVTTQYYARRAIQGIPDQHWA